MQAGFIRISLGMHGSACVLRAEGELTLATGPEFTARAAAALAVVRGPVLFDLAGLDFIDCHGARELAAAVHSAPPGTVSVHGASPAVCRVLRAAGYDLPRPPVPVSAARASVPAPAAANPRSRGEALAELARATKATARQSAAEASGVMARLAATYTRIALSSRYRTPVRSEERGRLLTLSGRARDLSQQYQRNAGLRGLADTTP